MSAFAETLEPFLVIDTMGDTLTSYKLLQCLSHKSIQPLRFSLPWSDKACLNEIFRHLHLCILKTASLQASKRRLFLLQRTWAAVKRKPVHRLSFFQTNTDVKHVTSSTQLRKPLCRYATNPDINFDQLWFPPCTFQPWWDTPFPKAVPQKIDVESFFLLGVRISKKKRTEKTDRCWKMSATFFFRKFRWATFKTLLIFRYTDWLVEVLIMAYYTPYIIGQYNLLYTANFEKHCWQVAESARYLIGRASVSKLKFACLTLTHRDPKTKTPPKNTKRNMMKHVFFSKSTGLQGKVYK